jgi:hypothetical protein
VEVWPVSACVRSGYCCKKAPCGFGEGVPCIHLAIDPASSAGQYLCARYAEISAHPDAWLSPAFGAGCSSTLFNDDREQVILQLRRKET